MLALPSRVANHPRWVLPGLAALLLIGVFVAKSARLERRTRALRIASLSLIAVMSLVEYRLRRPADRRSRTREGIHDPTQLLLTGGAIWLTNVIVFGLWYWEFDRGGPVERAADPAVPRLRVPADDEPRARAGRLGTRLRRLPLRVIHECDGVQPNRRDAHDPLGEADHAHPITHLGHHPRARHRPRRQHLTSVGGPLPRSPGARRTRARGRRRSRAGPTTCRTPGGSRCRDPGLASTFECLSKRGVRIASS